MLQNIIGKYRGCNYWKEEHQNWYIVGFLIKVLSRRSWYTKEPQNHSIALWELSVPDHWVKTCCKVFFETINILKGDKICGMIFKVITLSHSSYTGRKKDPMSIFPFYLLSLCTRDKYGVPFSPLWVENNTVKEK